MEKNIDLNSLSISELQDMAKYIKDTFCTIYAHIDSKLYHNAGNLKNLLSDSYAGEIDNYGSLKIGEIYGVFIDTGFYDDTAFAIGELTKICKVKTLKGYTASGRSYYYDKTECEFRVKKTYDVYSGKINYEYVTRDCIFNCTGLFVSSSKLKEFQRFEMCRLDKNKLDIYYKELNVELQKLKNIVVEQENKITSAELRLQKIKDEIERKYRLMFDCAQPESKILSNDSDKKPKRL